MYNWFDHERPFEFVDNNGYLLTSNGEKSDGIDGHNAYDWGLPAGTPMYAVADGTIRKAGLETPFFCPLTNSMTAGIHVEMNIISGNEDFVVDYAHMTNVEVSEGQTVKRGDLIGYSGNTGCGLGDHLHFTTYRLSSDKTRYVQIDPYGWQGKDVDPWAIDAEGAESIYLWKPGEAPQRFLEAFDKPNPCEKCAAPVAITRFRWMGIDDAKNPNNEYIELTLDSRFAGKKFNLSGFYLYNNKGKKFKFPAGTQIKAGKPVKVYSGKGKKSANSIYLGSKKEVWSNLPVDCPVILYPDKKTLLYAFNLYNAQCKYLK